MLRATLCALLVVAATPLGAQEQKQPQASVGSQPIRGTEFSRSEQFQSHWV